jgi:Mlc titration factor MtfA (ptsG expression regulator)
MRSDFYTSRGTHVYFKDDLTNDEIDVERTVAKVEGALPEHLLSELEMIVVGWFEEFEERHINAFYKDGILHISNAQDDEEDMYDDIIHEVAHSIEDVYGYEIYQDGKIKEEFLNKRKRLHDKLWALGFKTPEQWFMEVEYNKEFDEYLLQKVGYDKLRMICTGLFINAYAPTSLREYFATGFTDFYLYPNHSLLKKTSPALYRKLVMLQDEENLDNMV